MNPAQIADFLQTLIYLLEDDDHDNTLHFIMNAPVDQIRTVDLSGYRQRWAGCYYCCSCLIGLLTRYWQLHEGTRVLVYEMSASDDSLEAGPSIPRTSVHALLFSPFNFQTNQSRLYRLIINGFGSATTPVIYPFICSPLTEDGRKIFPIVRDVDDSLMQCQSSDKLICQSRRSVITLQRQLRGRAEASLAGTPFRPSIAYPLGDVTPAPFTINGGFDPSGPKHSIPISVSEGAIIGGKTARTHVATSVVTSANCVSTTQVTIQARSRSTIVRESSLVTSSVPGNDCAMPSSSPSSKPKSVSLLEQLYNNVDLAGLSSDSSHAVASEVTSEDVTASATTTAFTSLSTFDTEPNDIDPMLSSVSTSSKKESHLSVQRKRKKSKPYRFIDRINREVRYRVDLYRSEMLEHRTGFLNRGNWSNSEALAKFAENVDELLS